ncbi:acyl-ACP--UDP-N-acetylglucosamine O-acyltransferase [bacterium]|nr:acyl-ACP--UDP-N-acetylglucosamine O-acyltransferase [bacterium]
MGGAQVHPTAIVAAGAELGDGVSVGAYSVIGAQVRIGAGTRVGPHVVIEGRTTIGARNEIFQFASIGAVPQDLKYHGEPSELRIGDENRIREFCTLQPGTEGGGMVTRVGNGNLLMNYAHVAHDCILGDRNIVANGTQLGGHVTIESGVVIGALSGIHQFARLGESAIIGAGSMVSQDVPPFCNATGDRATLHGLNSLGLKRRGLGAETIRAIRAAYRLMFQSGLRVAEAAARVRAEIPGVPEVDRFVAFIEASQRGVCREDRRRTSDAPAPSGDED